MECRDVNECLMLQRQVFVVVSCICVDDRTHYSWK